MREVVSLVQNSSRTARRRTWGARIQLELKKNAGLYLLDLVPFVYLALFKYWPMYGVQIAFRDYTFAKGITGSDWVGLKWFREFFSSVYFGRVLKNTLLLSIFNLLWSFPVPIVFALFLNELKNGWYKKTVQTISYFPYFMSTVIVVGMLVNFVSPRFGIVNQLIRMLGGTSVDFMVEPKYFRSLYIITDVWKSFGWNSVIYLAALSGIDPQLYEAARIDGAGKWKQLLHVTIPCVVPTMIIMLILNVGNIMSLGFEKILLMYNPATYETADVISTYVYRRGIIGSQYSFGAAVGLFNSVINLVLLFSVNTISRRMSDVSLW